MSYSFYKILHMVAILAVFLSVGAAVHHAIIGGTKSSAARKLIGMTHGLAIFLVLLSGFGLLARLNIGFPGWIYGKLVIWLILGGTTAIAFKKPAFAKSLWFLLILLALAAAYLAQMKPF